jgi:4-azaleucine resistance transporter AzlC
MLKTNGLCVKALRYSIPVLLGYMAIGIGFGLLLTDAGYPWYLAPIMSIVMYGGAAQYLSIGLFASGVGIAQAVLIQLAVNARHMAYGFSLFKRIQNAGRYKWYLIFSLTDETFALHSTIKEGLIAPADLSRFMFYVSVLDQSYWITGSAIGALVGSLIPFDSNGVGFALTALFIVLMIDQIFTTKAPMPFVVGAVCSVLALLLLPANLTIIAAMLVSVAVCGRQRRRAIEPE